MSDHERAYERLRVAAKSMHDALGVLKGWDDDFGSRSITEAVWTARDGLAAALKALPPAHSAVVVDEQKEAGA